MSFFSDLEKKINQAGQAVTDKAGNIADSSKLNYRISSEEKALAELYRQLGSAYYTERGSCPDEKLKATCESISQALERIADLRRQEAAARGKRLCPHCGSDCDPYQPFCYVCRGELTPAASGPRLCPCCASPLLPDAAFCTACGAKL